MRKETHTDPYIFFSEVFVTVIKKFPVSPDPGPSPVWFHLETVCADMTKIAGGRMDWAALSPVIGVGLRGEGELETVLEGSDVKTEAKTRVTQS